MTKLPFKSLALVGFLKVEVSDYFWKQFHASQNFAPFQNIGESCIYTIEWCIYE